MEKRSFNEERKMTVPKIINKKTLEIRGKVIKRED
jgi:hypothetical protein